MDLMEAPIIAATVAATTVSMRADVPGGTGEQGSVYVQTSLLGAPNELETCCRTTTSNHAVPQRISHTKVHVPQGVSFFDLENRVDGLSRLESVPYPLCHNGFRPSKNVVLQRFSSRTRPATLSLRKFETYPSTAVFEFQKFITYRKVNTMPMRKCDNPKCRKLYSFSKPQSRFCSDVCRAANKGAPKPERARQREFFVSDHPDTDPVEILKMRRDAKRLIAEGRVAEGEAAFAVAMAKWNALPPSVTDPNAENW